MRMAKASRLEVVKYENNQKMTGKFSLKKGDG